MGYEPCLSYIAEFVGIYTTTVVLLGAEKAGVRPREMLCLASAAVAASVLARRYGAVLYFAHSAVSENMFRAQHRALKREARKPDGF